MGPYGEKAARRSCSVALKGILRTMRRLAALGASPALLLTLAAGLGSFLTTSCPSFGYIIWKVSVEFELTILQHTLFPAHCTRNFRPTNEMLSLLALSNASCAS